MDSSTEYQSQPHGSLNGLQSWIMAIPLHSKISEKLRSQIEAGQYLPGEKLPSEHQLMTTFDVSRITARRAIANLVSQGLAHTQRGKGAFVKPQQKVAYSLSSPLVFLEQDLTQKGVQLTFENLTFRKVRPLKQTCKILYITGQSGVYLQKKLLRMDGAAGALDVSYLVSDLGQRFSTQLRRNMTFPILEKNNVAIEQIDAVIECTHADYEMSNYLEVPLGHPLMVYRYTAYSKNDRPVLHGETISRGDRFCYSLNTKR